MNIEEATKKIEDLHSVVAEVDSYEVTLIPKCDVVKIIEEIDHQPKPTLQKEVVEWLEGLKKEFPDNLPNQLYHVTRHGWGKGLEYKDSKTKETKILHNCGEKIKKDLVNALIYGYTVKKEKLYTVEISNPNALGTEVFVLAKNSFEQIVMKKKFGSDWKKGVVHQLTKKEIRKDFDWAWQWAEEVTE
ncbi:TPA: DUF1642 domain-containing protein [Streptococcus pyogenes]|uniref:DUF1642 domain-containing protein n=1 Tax=Streptococcus TaxID=1301 RepID=UPI000807038B|nr:MULTISPECIES: DUF1642 domain-containing protein [Streptococcus]OBZ06293.1 hypothetical protein BBG02_03320 [Streptococcus dysgalactiae subsp. equisimilis]SQG23035.1 phage protein [Streptococcus pyogenes]HER5321452.1 DUF1642 domain-containing protein [Streptococcus pyogenes]HER5325389.1 DUF1642 domain-containing protein [Streptococcus pyogenes]HER5328302.1 DUF1642 domain-containing protein [Streptococcus pyogenes]